MEDVTLIARLDNETIVYVSPVHDQTYKEFVENDSLGGSSGYFIARERQSSFEILAKAASLDAAREIFAMLTASLRPAS